MLTMFLMLMMMSSLMFMFLINPLTMVFTLLIQTFIVSSISAIFISSFWYSYMYNSLIMISGLLILFMYMASIASNEKMIFSFNAMIPAMLVLLFFKQTEVLMFLKEMYMSNNLIYQELTMNKLFNSKFIIPSIMMIMFLFMMMMVISFIVSKTEGPMRKSN
uniref:NADH dehydrogenase subunit 6 n=1 Tax=Corythucha ciliata TaxID=369451 RepID=V5JFG7_CORCT|nr:NADH dehydrogenase subunit 6 [Corythucha ciliata]AGM48386.1 NADH dehydrogenase subunit 6 [Corythucha ciliata]